MRVGDKGRRLWVLKNLKNNSKYVKTIRVKIGLSLLCGPCCNPIPGEGRGYGKFGRLIHWQFS